MMNIIFWFTGYLIFVVSLVSCAGGSDFRKPSEEVLTESIFEDTEKYVPKNGSLWPGETSDNLLFADTKAKDVGDIVTISLEENFESSNSATTGVSKNSEIDLSVDTVLGMPNDYGMSNFLGLGNSFDPNVRAETSRSTNGAGTTTRGGSMTGTMAAIIKEQLPNGMFRIEGRRAVTVNNEDQTMIITGLIRRVDIGFNNTISSNDIANANINYTGKGVISDEQNVGWLMRFFAWVWPF
jgi:flagellar L-ring protein precursor FlgH